MKCSICGKEIEANAWGYDQGNNAQPINDGRCCEECNNTKVIPERLRIVMGRKEWERLNLELGMMNIE